jgi:hypothetical protein
VRAGEQVVGPVQDQSPVSYGVHGFPSCAVGVTETQRLQLSPEFRFYFLSFA